MEPRFDNLDELLFKAKEEVNISSNYNEVLLGKLHAETVKDYKSENSFFTFFDKTAGLSFVMTGFLFSIVNIFGLSNQCIELLFKIKEIYLLINLR